ncbi:FeoA family protein [Thiohalobacter sp. IOR34]|uniref:FeoA family protein n=1 Tax=Thiohalobacter sp. IOR34 TaxID=3057176 RepID=UPI0025B0CDE7|nr:FeoA family protein [Thiohalobacter sp. IOR34]WJW76347.1 FeoA family protein [Thiohalobacter sp. IOR34]
MDHRVLPFKTELLPGTECVIEGLGSDERLTRHLLEIGIMPGLQVRVVRRGPFGDPVELALPGSHSIVLRNSELASLQCRFLAGPLSALPSKAAGEFRVRALVGNTRYRARMQRLGLEPGSEFRLLPSNHNGRHRLQPASRAEAVEIGRGEAERLIIEAE